MLTFSSEIIMIHINLSVYLFRHLFMYLLPTPIVNERKSRKLFTHPLVIHTN